MSNWKTKNSALDLYSWSPPPPRLICTLLTASYSCALAQTQEPAPTSYHLLCLYLTRFHFQSIRAGWESAYTRPVPVVADKCDCTSWISACLSPLLTSRKAEVTLFAVGPRRCSLPHNARGCAKHLQIQSCVLPGTALDIKQEKGGLKSHLVEQNCHDQWVMFVIFRNTIKTGKWNASRDTMCSMVMFNWLEGLSMSM